jgi:hypothetical protein
MTPLKKIIIPKLMNTDIGISFSILSIIDNKEISKNTRTGYNYLILLLAYIDILHICNLWQNYYLNYLKCYLNNMNITIIEQAIIMLKILNVKEIMFDTPKAWRLTIDERQILGRLRRIIVKGISNKNVFP